MISIASIDRRVSHLGNSKPIFCGYRPNRRRSEREQRNLSRTERGSNNWERERRQVAEVHRRMTDRKNDFKHELARFTPEYDAVFVEDLGEGDAGGRRDRPGYAAVTGVAHSR